MGRKQRSPHGIRDVMKVEKRGWVRLSYDRVDTSDLQTEVCEYACHAVNTDC